MPISYQWHDSECDIIVVNVTDSWSWTDVRQCFIETGQWIQMCDRLVYTVVDVRSELPNNLLFNIEGLNIMRQPNAGPTYIIGGGKRFTILVNILQRMNVALANNIRRIDSVSEAIQAIRDEQNKNATHA